MDGILKELQKLHPARLVEAERSGKPGAVLRGRIHREHLSDRIADELKEHEGDGGDGKKHHKGFEKPSQKKSWHLEIRFSGAFFVFLRPRWGKEAERTILMHQPRFSLPILP